MWRSQLASQPRQPPPSCLLRWASGHCYTAIYRCWCYRRLQAHQSWYLGLLPEAISGLTYSLMARGVCTTLCSGSLGTSGAYQHSARCSNIHIYVILAVPNEHGNSCRQVIIPARKAQKVRGRLLSGMPTALGHTFPESLIMKSFAAPLGRQPYLGCTEEQRLTLWDLAHSTPAKWQNRKADTIVCKSVLMSWIPRYFTWFNTVHYCFKTRIRMYCLAKMNLTSSRTGISKSFQCAAKTFATCK